MIMINIKLSLFRALALAVVMVFSLTSLASAMSVEQKRIIDSGSLYFNVEESCRARSGSTLSTSSVEGSVYILGDSITNQSRSSFETIIENDPDLTISKINADPGRAISYDSTGGNPTGLEAVEMDSGIISETSGAIVVALGTNSGREDLNIQIPALLERIKSHNPDTHIFWVNMFYTSNPEGKIARNEVVASNSINYNYTVIDTVQAEIELQDDGIHPTVNGNAVFAQTVIDGLQISDASDSHQVVSGDCSCSVSGAGGKFPPIDSSITWGEGVWTTGSDTYVSGLTGPYTIEQWAIHVLKNISRKSGVSEDIMVTQNKVIALIAWAKIEGGGVDGHNGTFNPLNTKSSYSDIGGVNQGNSSNDTNSSGFSSFDAGVEAITRGLFNTYQKRIGSALLSPSFAPDTLVQVKAGDFSSPDGVSVTNNLENIYPGEKPFAMASVTGFVHGAPFNNGVGDRELYIQSTSSSLESVLEDYESYAGKILDGSPSGDPEPLVFSSSGTRIGAFGSSAGCGRAASGGSGLVNPDGYSFPLAPQRRSQIGGIRSGQTLTTHHDDTPAFDLLYDGVAGQDVYAVYDGVIDNIGTQEAGWCQSIQLFADDGYYYWYGHLIDLAVNDGDRVVAGQQLGKVAEWTPEHTCNGTSGAAHLHIDRGCTIDGEPQGGGRDECRDPDFIPFLSKLYDTLPS